MGFHSEGVGKDTTADLNRDRKLARVRGGTAHAALVFAGDDCVGWCQFGAPDEVPKIKNLTEKAGGKPFTDGDEESAVALARYRITNMRMSTVVPLDFVDVGADARHRSAIGYEAAESFGIPAVKGNSCWRATSNTRRTWSGVKPMPSQKASTASTSPSACRFASQSQHAAT